MFPEGPGGMFTVEYDYQNQNQNWQGSSSAPGANNPDKHIETSWVTAGFQYMFDRSWGLQLEVPYEHRSFTTTDAAGGLATVNWGDLGDIRVRGIYTGFSPDLSTGVTFGLKLPTGNYTYNDAGGDVDRDSEIGTGSTDLLLGAFHRGNLPASLAWFAQADLDIPFLTRDEYQPGAEGDGAAGIYYNGLTLGRAKIAPLAEVIASKRMSDHGSGATSDPITGGAASGYDRVLVGPGLEVHVHPVMVFADVEFPVYVRTTGDQLVAPALFKVVVSYMF
jgi:hypothetical protein